MAQKKKVVKKKVVKKKVVKKKVTEKPVVTRKAKPKSPAADSNDLIERLVNVVESNQRAFTTLSERLIDVVEVNTLTAKSNLVVISQMQQMLVMALNPVVRTPLGDDVGLTNTNTNTNTSEQLSAEETKKQKAKIRRENKAKKDAAAKENMSEIPPQGETDVPSQVETAATTPMPTMAELSQGFAKMKEMIGQVKAAEYLGRYNGCTSISALDEKYWRIFRDNAMAFVEETRRNAEVAVKGKAPSESDVRQALNDVANAYGKTDVMAGRSHAIALLTQFGGAKSVPQLGVEDYASLVAVCAAEIAKA